MGETVSIGEEMTKIFIEDGVKAAFGVTAYHTEPPLGLFPRHGGEVYMFRHEQSGAYAADGYAGASRNTAICFGTAGPGVTNMMSGVAQMYQNMRPCVVLCGMHGGNVDKHWGLQEAYPVPLMQSITKLAWQVNEYRALLSWVRKAIKTAREYPPGPVALATTSAITGNLCDKDDFTFIEARSKVAYPSPTAGDPKTVAKAVENLLAAKRPFIVAGDGVYWANAEEEIKEFMELTQIPCCFRRTARGTMPETEDLSIGPGWRGVMQGNADVIALIGLREGITEGMMFAPPMGPYRRDCDYVQINEAASEMVDFLPTSVMLTGNCKLVLRQMIDCAKDILKDRKPDRSEWINMAIEGRKKFWTKVKADAERDKDKSPVSGPFFGKELGEFISSMGKCAVVLDSFTGSFASSNKYVAKEAGMSQDTAGWSGVGNSIAQAFGIQVARPDMPVCCIIGDGGMGIGAMELETCVRYKKPVVAVVFNNSEWIGGSHELLYSTGVFGDSKVMQDQPYEKMFEPIGCHGEFVNRPEQMKPALERAFNSGKPAVVNVMVDPMFMHPWVPQNVLAGYLKWYGVERCKELNVYQDKFWTEILAGVEGGPDALRDVLVAVSPIFGF
jgi:acetolactate synthase-1/2/3 large subunit